MKEFLLFFILIVSTLFSFIYGGNRLLSPWFLFCFSILASYCLVLLNLQNWNVAISWKFILYIVSAIFAFGCGCCIIRLVNKSPRTTCNLCLNMEFNRSASKYPINIFLCVSVVFSTIYILKLLSSAASVDGFFPKLRFIYANQLDGYSPGFIYNQLDKIAMAISYVNTYRLMVRLNVHGDKISIFKLLLPIGIFILSILVSTNRNALIQYAIYVICIWVLIYEKYNHKKRNVNIIIIFRAVLMVLCAGIIFYLFGKAKLYTSDFFTSISIYGGSGLYNLNLWLDEFDYNLLYGQSTFTTFVSSLGALLNYLGLHIVGGQIDQIDPFIRFMSPNGYFYESNIYSAMRPYIQDFGYFGVIIFPFIIGLFYQWLFMKTDKSRLGYSWVIYCAFIYPIIYFPILERLFRRFHLGLIYEVFWITVMFFVAFKKHWVKRYLKIQKLKVTKGAK